MVINFILRFNDKSIYISHLLYEKIKIIETIHLFILFVLVCIFVNAPSPHTNKHFADNYNNKTCKNYCKFYRNQFLYFTDEPYQNNPILIERFIFTESVIIPKIKLIK